MQEVKICVKGHLDMHWSEWLGDLQITHTGQNQTLLTGFVEDHSALYGILTKLKNLGLKLVSVNVEEPSQGIHA